MFARIKKAGRYEYLQIVENRREDKKSVQRIIATVGRIDHLKGNGDIEGLIRSLSRFSERVLMVLSGQSNGIHAERRKSVPPSSLRDSGRNGESTGCCIVFSLPGSLPSMWEKPSS